MIPGASEDVVSIHILIFLTCLNTGTGKQKEQSEREKERYKSDLTQFSEMNASRMGGQQAPAKESL